MVGYNTECTFVEVCIFRLKGEKKWYHTTTLEESKRVQMMKLVMLYILYVPNYNEYSRRYTRESILPSLCRHKIFTYTCSLAQVYVYLQEAFSLQK